MRRSSRGNPNHDRLGRFASYPEAKYDCKGNEIDWGNMPEDHKPVMQSEKTEEEYEQRTIERMAKTVGEYGFTGKEVNGNTHFGLRGDAASHYIRYGSKSSEYDPEKVEPVSNNNHGINKPYGGVWASPSNSTWGWKEWTEAEGMEEWNRNPQELKLNGAKILHIYDKEQVDKLPQTKGIFGDSLIDFEEVSKHYDAMEVHVSEGNGLSECMYGWDCDSVVIFSPEHIQINGVKQEEG